ncbi:MAG: HEAT repeat domain-containing protein, partial [Bryobacteraceae bacterium]|nr:HEAT repeat domain-containing protein [Bryobacteraceae bacterium]
MLYGELTFDEEENVQQHLDTCEVCQGELARAKALHTHLDAAEADVPAALLVDARRRLRLNVAATGESRTKRSWSWPQAAVWWKPAAAMALLTVGFLAGRGLPAEVGSGAFRMASGVPAATRVRFVQPDGAGRVQIVVEEVTQRVLEGGLQDNRIRSLLVAATREANDPGVRVETLDLLKGQSASSAEVRRALLSALQNDPNPGVRLKALEALRGRTDGETRRVLGQVLLTDDNPGIRTQAIDLLTQQQGPEMVGVLQE